MRIAPGIRPPDHCGRMMTAATCGVVFLHSLAFAPLSPLVFFLLFLIHLFIPAMGLCHCILLSSRHFVLVQFGEKRRAPVCVKEPVPGISPLPGTSGNLASGRPICYFILFHIGIVEMVQGDGNLFIPSVFYDYVLFRISCSSSLRRRRAFAIESISRLLTA